MADNINNQRTPDTGGAPKIAQSPGRDGKGMSQETKKTADEQTRVVEKTKEQLQLEQQIQKQKQEQAKLRKQEIADNERLKKLKEENVQQTKKEGEITAKISEQREAVEKRLNKIKKERDELIAKEEEAQKRIAEASKKREELEKTFQKEKEKYVKEIEKAQRENDLERKKALEEEFKFAYQYHREDRKALDDIIKLEKESLATTREKGVELNAQYEKQEKIHARQVQHEEKLKTQQDANSKAREKQEEVIGSILKNVSNINRGIAEGSQEFAYHVNSVANVGGKNAQKTMGAIQSIVSQTSNTLSSISTTLAGVGTENTQLVKQTEDIADGYVKYQNTVTDTLRQKQAGRLTDAEALTTIKKQREEYEDLVNQIDASTEEGKALVKQFREGAAAAKEIEKQLEKSVNRSEDLGSALQQSSALGVGGLSEMGPVLKSIKDKDVAALRTALMAMGAAVGAALFNYFGSAFKHAKALAADYRIAQVDLQLQLLDLDAQRAQVNKRAAADFANTMKQNAITFNAAAKTALFGKGIGSVNYGVGQLQQLGISAETIASTMTAISNTVGKMPTAKLASDMAVFAQRSGMSADEVAGLNEAIMLTSDRTADAALNLQAGIEGLANKIGVSFGDLAKDISAASKDMLSYGIKNVEQLAKQVAYAKSLGVSFQEIANAGKSMVMNYQQSIKAEMELSALLGESVDLSEVRAKFAEGDQAGAMEALKATGLNPEDMDMFQQEALKSALGGMDITSLQKIATKEGKTAELGTASAQAGNKEYIGAKIKAEQEMQIQTAKLTIDKAEVDARLDLELLDIKNNNQQAARSLLLMQKDQEEFHKNFMTNLGPVLAAVVGGTLMSGLTGLFTKLFTKGAAGAGVQALTSGATPSVASGAGSTAAATGAQSMAGAGGSVTGGEGGKKMNRRERRAQARAARAPKVSAPKVPPAVGKITSGAGKLADTAGQAGGAAAGGGGIAGFLRGIALALATPVPPLGTAAIALPLFFLSIGAALLLATPAIKAIAPVLIKLAEVIGTVLVTALKEFAPVVLKIVEVVGTVLVEALKQAGPIITAILQGIASIIKTVGEAIATYIGAIGTTIATVIKAITGAVLGGLTVVGSIITSILGSIADIITAVGNSIATVVTAIGSAIEGVISTITNSIKSLADIDPLKLYALAGGITAVGLSLAAFGAGSAGGAIIGAVGGAIAKGINFLSGQDTRDPFERLKEMATYADPITNLGKSISGLSADMNNLNGISVDTSNLSNIAKAISEVGNALASFGTGQMSNAVGGLMSAGVKLLTGKESDPFEKLKEMASYSAPIVKLAMSVNILNASLNQLGKISVDTAKLQDVANAIGQVSKSLGGFAGGQMASSVGGLFSAGVKFFTGRETDPFKKLQEMAGFAEPLKTLSGSVDILSTSMSKLSAVNFAGIQKGLTTAFEIDVSKIDIASVALLNISDSMSMIPQKLAPATDGLKTFIAMVLDVTKQFGEAVTTILNNVMEGVKSFATIIVEVSTAVGTAIVNVLNSISSGVNTFMDVIIKAIKTFGETISSTIKLIADTITTGIESIAGAIKHVVDIVVNGVMQLAKSIKEVGKAIVSVLDGIVDSITKLAKLGAEQTANLFSLAGGITAVAASLAAFGAGAGGGEVLGALGGAFAKGVKFLSGQDTGDMFERIKDMTKYVDPVKQLAQAISMLSTEMTKLASINLESVNKVNWSGMTGFLQAQQIGQTVSNIGSGIGSSISKGVSAVMSFVTPSTEKGGSETAATGQAPVKTAQDVMIAELKGINKNTKQMAELTKAIEMLTEAQYLYDTSGTKINLAIDGRALGVALERKRKNLQGTNYSNFNTNG